MSPAKTAPALTRRHMHHHLTKALQAAEDARERQEREQYGKSLGLMAQRLTGVLRGMEGMTS